jgi:hypothetical protein
MQLAEEWVRNRLFKIARRSGWTGCDDFKASRAVDPLVAPSRSITDERGAIFARGMTDERDPNEV